MVSQLISQLQNGLWRLRNGTLVLEGIFVGGVLWLRNFALEGFIVHFAVVKWAFGLRIGTCVPRNGFTATKIFVGGVLWL